MKRALAAVAIAAAFLSGCVAKSQQSSTATSSSSAAPACSAFVCHHPTPKPSPTPSPKPTIAPSPTPTVAPTPTPTPIGTAFYDCGYQYPFNVAGPAAQDPNSAAYIYAIVHASTSTNPNGGFFPVSYSIATDEEQLNLASSSTPRVHVAPQVAYHTPYTPVPYLSSYFIEETSDHHLFVLDQSACALYEYYSTQVVSGGLSAYGGYQDYLGLPFEPAANATGSDTASHIAMAPLSITPEDLANGKILHTMGWRGVAHAFSQTASRYPASATDSIAYDPPSGGCNAPLCIPAPYGILVFLPASFNDSGWTPTARMIVTAWQTYGMFFYDTANSGNEISTMCDPSGCPSFDSTTLSELKTITPSMLYVGVAPQAP